MNYGKRRANDQIGPVTPVTCGSAVANIACQRIELGGWRVLDWRDHGATDPSQRSFWRTPGLYARRLARSR